MGRALVSTVLREGLPGVWRVAALCVVPIWLPLFDRTLSRKTAWPFTGGQTLYLLELAGGHDLHSAGKYVSSWEASSDWVFRFAAFRWRKVNGSMDESVPFTLRLLGEIDESFRPPEEGIASYTWQAEFWDLEARKQELRCYLEESAVNPDTGGEAE